MDKCKFSLFCMFYFVKSYKLDINIITIFLFSVMRDRRRAGFVSICCSPKFFLNNFSVAFFFYFYVRLLNDAHLMRFFFVYKNSLFLVARKKNQYYATFNT